MKQVKSIGKKSKESLFYTVEVTDKEGRVLKRISAPSRSYVKAWNQIMYTFCGDITVGGATIPIKDTAGVDQPGYHATASLSADAILAEVDIGIRIGKGTTAVAIDDYALESPCDEGSGVDEFEHQAQQFTEPVVVGSDCSFSTKRVMLNNSGATITGIREIGCYVQFAAAGAGKEGMGFRDVLPSAVTIPDGGAITVTYILKVTV